MGSLYGAHGTHSHPRYGKRMHQIPHRGFEKWGSRCSSGEGPPTQSGMRPPPPQGHSGLIPLTFSPSLPSANASSSVPPGAAVGLWAPQLRRYVGVKVPFCLALRVLPPNALPACPVTLSSARSIPHCHSTCCPARVALLAPAAGCAPRCAWVRPRPAVARNDSALPALPRPRPSSTIPVDRNDVALEISYPGFSTPEHGSD